MISMADGERDGGARNGMQRTRYGTKSDRNSLKREVTLSRVARMPWREIKLRQQIRLETATHSKAQHWGEEGWKARPA